MLPLLILNGRSSTDSRVLDLYSEYERTKPNFRSLIKKEKFNFSRAINRGIKRASGEHFLLPNNDVEIIETNWLKEMVSCLNF